ncbi:hypothetical protein [Acidocella sp. MX-AZ02]|uniref:beta strand repeat-containing protein n=1 Tax=Acidocella sp. MX-AZ02 TaxID=1214225 RepID=UPI00211086FB|nr:hypothetical protein [Acidocella sp. MX-AZ02]
MSTSLQEDGEGASDPIVNVSSGGSAIDTVVRSGGGLIVLPGGTISDSLVDYNGVISVGSGGIATQSTITAGGAELVESGGISTGATITGGLGQGTTVNLLGFSEGSQMVISGGAVDDSFVGPAGILDVYAGGSSSNTTISTSGTSIIYAGGVSNNLQIQSGGEAVVEADGTLHGATVASHGTLLALPGSVIDGISGSGTIIAQGVAKGIFPAGGAPIITNYGAVLNGGTLSGTATDYALVGGTINALTVLNHGTAIAYSGASLNADIIQNLGTVITDGGTANNLTIASNGMGIIDANSTNYDTHIQSGGMQIVLSAGTATNTIIQQGGSQYLASGGTAQHSTIGLGGIEIVHQGATSFDPHINAGGIEIVNTGGTVFDPVVENGGFLINLTGGNVVGGSATNLQNALIDINKLTGNFTETSNSADISIASGHVAVIEGSLAALQNITVTSGGTLDVAAGSTLNSIELDGGALSVAPDAHIGSVTIDIGVPGQFTNAANTDISTLLNSELRAIPTGTSITVIFNPGDYGASSPILLGNNTSVLGNGATLGALANFNGNELIGNFDQQVNGYTWTINNIDGSTTVVDGGVDGGALSNVATTTNDIGTNPSTSLQAELPVLNTEYAQADNSTPIVDTNITVRGMTLVEGGSISGQSTMGLGYGSVGRGIWLNDSSNVSISDNVLISGYSGMSLVDDSNIVVANNIIIGSVVPIDAWSGASNFVAENNLLWEYSSTWSSGSTGAIQLNASANAYPSSPGLNNNGTTTNDGLIGNSISGIGSPTWGIAADPLYPYGSTSESNITEQGNIDNALGNNMGGYYSVNVKNMTLTDNVYAGGSQNVVNSDAAAGAVQTSITTANGVVSGNVVLDNSGTTTSSAITNNNINPTTVDNSVFAASSVTAGSISTWGFTGTSTTAGNFVTGSNSIAGASVEPPIFISTVPYIQITTQTIELTGSLAPEILDLSSNSDVSVTLSSIFGTISSGANFGTEFHTIVNQHDALIIQGSLGEVNQDLASLQYVASFVGTDDALEISVSDTGGHSMTHYVPILWNSDAGTNASLPETLAAGLFASLTTGTNLTGEVIIATTDSVINMGTTVSAVFASAGNNTVNSGIGPEYVSTGQGTAVVNLGSSGDITIAGGAGALIVNGTAAGSSSHSLIESGQSAASITGGDGAISVVGGQGNLVFQGGAGSTFLTTAPEGGGNLSANLGAGNSTVFALSGDSIIRTQNGTSNTIVEGYGNSHVFSNGLDTITGGSGSMWVQTGQADTTITGGAGAATVTGGQGNLSYQGGSGTTLLTSAATNGGSMTLRLGTGNSTINALSGNDYIQTQANTENSLSAGSGNDTVISNGLDTITGGSGSMWVQTGQADTTITGGAGAATVTGGQGNLSYQGGSGTTLLTSAATNGGSMTLRLGTGNSTINALSGNDYIQTQANTENEISLGSGFATVVSGGSDLIHAGPGSLLVESTMNAQDTVISGSGKIIAENIGQNSNLSINVASNGATINLGKGDAVTIGSSDNTVAAANNILVNNILFSETNGGNVINLGSNDFFSSNERSSGAGNVLNVIGSNNSGFISPQDISNISLAGAGNLFVLGGASHQAGAAAIVNGSDTLSVLTSANSINADNGATLFVTSDDNTIAGSNAKLTLQGQGNIITLIGNATVSDANPWTHATQQTPISPQNEFTVQGGQFNLGGLDTLLQTNSAAAITLAGGNSVMLDGNNDSVVANDQVYGGNQIVINGSNDSVNVQNISDGTATIDANINAFVNVTDSHGPKIGGVNNNNNEHLLFIGGSGSSSTVLAANSNTEVTVFGGASGNNIVSGGKIGNNYLNGGSGSGDLFRAGGTNDLLIGGSHGSNTLVSAMGNETLTGAGLGNDLFSITGGGGTDVIGDFTGHLIVASNLSVTNEAVIGGSLNVVLSDGTHVVFQSLTNVNQQANIFSSMRQVWLGHS